MLITKVGNYLRFCSSFNREREARGRLGGLGVERQLGLTLSFLYIVVDGAWGKLKIATCLERFIICLDLKERPLQVTKLLKTARLGVW